MGTKMELIIKEDYDEKYSVNDKEIKCYSKNAMKELYPDGNYEIVGETFEKNKKTKISDILLGGKNMIISKRGDNSGILYKRAGFIEVGEGKYLVLLKSRLAFLLLLSGLFLGAVAATVITIVLWNQTPALESDYLLPAEDDRAVSIEGDDSEKMESEKGGGAVSIGYSLEANIDLETGNVTMFLQNPNASNKDMVVTLYAVSGDKEAAIARSGLVKAGKELTAMTLHSGHAKLESGSYQGYFMLDFYEPDSREKALMDSKIEDVKITVK